MHFERDAFCSAFFQGCHKMRLKIWINVAVNHRYRNATISSFKGRGGTTLANAETLATKSKHNCWNIQHFFNTSPVHPVLFHSRPVAYLRIIFHLIEDMRLCIPPDPVSWRFLKKPSQHEFCLPWISSQMQFLAYALRLIWLVTFENQPAATEPFWQISL